MTTKERTILEEHSTMTTPVYVSHRKGGAEYPGVLRQDGTIAYVENGRTYYAPACELWYRPVV